MEVEERVFVALPLPCMTVNTSQREKIWDRPRNKANVNHLLPKTNLWPLGPDYLTDNPGIKVMYYNYVLSCHGNLVVKDYGCKENTTYTWVHGAWG